MPGHLDRPPRPGRRHRPAARTPDAVSSPSLAPRARWIPDRRGSRMTSSKAGGWTPLLSAEKAAEVRERFGTPCYVYDRATLEATARRALAFPAPYGFTLRYAMKANPSRGILAVFRALGLHVDASSDWEVERALRAGFAPEQILLTSQMPSHRIAEHIGRGVFLNALLLAPVGGIRPRYARTRDRGPHEPRTRQRLGEAHEHRRSLCELRHLARLRG